MPFEKWRLDAIDQMSQLTVKKKTSARIRGELGHVLDNLFIIADKYQISIEEVWQATSKN